MIRLRHQLAAYSPISVGSCLRASSAAIHLSSDPRPELIDVLREDYQADAALLCGSGTQALQTAITLAVATRGRGAIAALPAYTCFDVASAAIGADVSVAFYDVDAETLGPDLGSLERVLAEGAGVVVIAPSYGLAVDWPKIAALGERYGASIIEDAAQGQGASLNGVRLGALGDISVLSFGRGKGSTGGGGGAVLLRGAARNHALALPESGFAVDAKGATALYVQWLLGRPSIYGIPRAVPSLKLGETVYHDPRRPCGMTRSSAAAIIAEREPSMREAERRRNVAARYTNALGKVAGAAMFRPAGGSIPGYLRFPVRVLGGVSSFARDAAGELSDEVRELGVERGYPISIARLAQIRDRVVGGEREFPGAEQLVKEIVTLPTHSRLSAADEEMVLRLWETGGAFRS